VIALILGIIALIRIKNGRARGGVMAWFGAGLGALASRSGWCWGSSTGTSLNDVGFTDYFDCIRSADNDKAKVQQCEDDFNQRSTTGARRSLRRRRANRGARPGRGYHRGQLGSCIADRRGNPDPQAAVLVGG